MDGTFTPPMSADIHRTYFFIFILSHIWRDGPPMDDPTNTKRPFLHAHLWRTELKVLLYFIGQLGLFD